MNWRFGQTLKALVVGLLLQGALPLPAQEQEKAREPSRKLMPKDMGSNATVLRIPDDPGARGDWLLYWYGGKAPLDYLKFRLGVATREVARWQDRFPALARPGQKVSPAASSVPVWRSLGPTKEPVTAARPDMDGGRLVSVVTHPTDPKTLYVATAAGGVFKTTNADYASSGPWTWTNITDTIPSTSSGGSTSVGALAMSPADPNTLYLSMGDTEGQTVGNSASGCIGFYKSTDGGGIWSSPVILGATTYTHAILPLTANIVLVGGDDGLYRSSDGGDTFSKITTGLALDTVWSLQAFSSSDLVCTQYKSYTGAIYASDDAGLTWTKATLSGLPGTPGRMTVATSAASATQGWALLGLSDQTFAKGLLKTIDNGHTWTYLAAPTAPGSLFQTYTDSFQSANDGGLPFYTQDIAVDPADANKVWAGANHALYRTLDGGTSWVQMAYGYDQDTVYAHPDYHCSAWAKTGPPTLYLGNDGGLCIVRDPYRTPIPRSGSSASQPSDPTYIDNRWNQGINSHEVWRFGNTAATTPATARNQIVAGLQDNGTRVRVDDGGGLASSTCFGLVIGGDGMAGHIHALNGNMAMGGSQNMNLVRTLDGWTTQNAATIGITEAGGRNAPFVTNLIPDLSDSANNTLYTHSFTKIYRTTNYGAAWTALASSPIASSEVIRNMAVSRSNPQTLAVVVKGGRGYLTTNGGTGWTTLGTLPNSSGNLSCVTFDPTTSSTLYVGSVAQVATASHLWQSTDGGNLFMALDANPGFPTGVVVESLVVDPTHSGVLYVATDLGMYQSLNRGATWARFGSGLPLVNVKDLYIAPDSSFLRAATFGRGIWEITLSPYGPTLTTQPASQAVYAGQTATFTVAATATSGSLSYQWKKGGAKVGANASSYTTPAATGSDSGAQFTVAVTDDNGTATSDTATLTVILSPAVTAISPSGGLVGTTITLTGTSFAGATAVRFNGTSATFTVVSATSITATVPTGATTGTVSVTTPAGIGTSASSFTVKTRDFNGDGVTDVLDLATIARAYGATPASTNWNAAADLNGDSVVDDLDLALFLGGLAFQVRSW